MSKIQTEMVRAARHARRPLAERRAFGAGSDEHLAIGVPVRCYVDGKEYMHVLVADEIRGEVVCAADPLRVNKTGDGIEVEVHRGVVGMEWEGRA